MKVLKFGGTSVGTVESLRNVKAIVESQQTDCIVTVSALGGITDRLIDCARRASVGDTTYTALHQEMKERHHSVIEGVVADATRRTEVIGQIDELLSQLATLYDAIALLGELTPRTMDLIVSYGERMSCIIVCKMLSDAVLCYSPDFIRTRLSYGKHMLAAEATARLIYENVAPELSRSHTIVVPGFIARDENSGKITNLGRGGSDYTAAILAAELGAEVLEIWTDVDGFMTADPRIIKDAAIIDHLSFVEAMELCNFGAKVVYSPTIYPVFNRNIPIVIKNTFNPSAPGTVIADGVPYENPRLAGISSMTPTAIIRISGCQSVNFDRVFNSLSRNGVDIFMASPENNTFGLRGADVDNNLAVALARSGYKVGLLDADIFGPSIPKMFGLEHAELFMHEVDGRDLIIPAEKFGVKLLSIGFMVSPDKPVLWRGSMASNALNQLITQADWGELDYFLIDMPPGTSDIHLTLVQTLGITGVVIVSTPQEVALADARKGVAMFMDSKVNVPVLGIVENMAWFTPAPHHDERYYIFGREGAKRLAEELGVKLLGQIPIVADICGQADNGEPIALADSPEGIAFVSLAAEVKQAVDMRNSSLPPTSKVELKH